MNTLRAAVLVEGNSDRVALQTLAERRGRDLAAEGIEVVAMGGITNTRAFASRYGPRGLGVQLAGLYDAPEACPPPARPGGGGSEPSPSSPTGRNAWASTAARPIWRTSCIRALGVEAVEAVIEEAGETNSLRLLAGMPAQRDWTREAVLRRFFTSQSGRKARYAALLVEALEPDRVPEPLAAVLARV